MLNSYFKWLFALREKKVVRLKHKSSRSQLFKQAPDSVRTGSLFSDHRKEALRKTLRALRIVAVVVCCSGIVWIGWESLKAFNIY